MLFSVIVPVYNVDKYVKQCIESILSQTFSDFELILVDDGSTDNSGKICDKYLSDNRVKIIHKQNGGLVSARKAGAVIAGGDYVVIVDSDDYVVNDYLEDAKKIIDQYNPDMIFYKYSNVDMTGKRIFPPKEYSIDIKKGLNNRVEINQFTNKSLFDVPPNIWGKVIKRGLYQEYQAKVDERICVGEDMAVTLPAFQVSNMVYNSDKPVYYYRRNPLSITKSKKRLIKGDDTLLRIYHFNKVLSNFDGKKEQISAYAAHSLILSAFSYFNNFSYFESCTKINKILNDKIWGKFSKVRPHGTIKERLSHILLKYRIYPIIKLLSLMYKA